MTLLELKEAILLWRVELWYRKMLRRHNHGFMVTQRQENKRLKFIARVSAIDARRQLAYSDH